MDDISTEQELKKRKEKGSETEVITPNKSPSWKFGLSVTFAFVVLPLLIFAGFYFGLFRNL